MSPPQSTEGQSLALGILALLASIGTIGANSLALGPIAAIIAAEYNTELIVVMRAAAAFGLGTAIAALGLTPLIDKLGARRVLLASLSITVFGFAISAISPSVVWFIGSQALAGLTAGVALPSIYAFSAQIAPQGRESEVLGRVLIGWTVSLVIGVPLATLITDAISWRWVYATFCILTLLALVLLKATSDSTSTPEDESRYTLDISTETTPSVITEVAISRSNNKVIWPHTTLALSGVGFLLLMCFTFMLAFYGVYGYLGSHVVSVLELSVKANGLLAIAYGIGFGLAALGDRFIDRVDVFRAMPWTFATISIVYASVALSSKWFPALVVFTFFWGLVNHVGVNLIVSALSAIDAKKRGAILGAYSATAYLAASVAALAFGWLYNSTNFAALAWVAACLILIASVVSFLRIR